MGIEMTDLEDAKGIAGVAGKPQYIFPVLRDKYK